MNPHASRSVSPAALMCTLYENRWLVFSLIKREVVSRYRGSIMGLLWSFFTPVLMLSVYTFVFSMIFKTRWGGSSDSKTEFALILFAGLIIYNLFAECVNRAPALIIDNVNYVKKVIFPLELLPIISFGSASFQFIVSFLVWTIFFCIFSGIPPFTIFWLPVVLIPVVLSSLGLSWFLAALGVFIRDITQIVGVFMTILMFLSPIFYPISALPEEYRVLMNINPLTFVVEQARNVMIFGRPMAGVSWFVQLVFSSLIAWLGFAWFQKTRKGFADVL